MWDKFTPSALTIIKSAAKEARLSGHEAVGTPHLLVSLMRQRTADIRAAQALRDFDLRPDEVYSELIAINQAPPAEGKLPFAPEAESALRAALAAARREHFQQIGGDQLLIGLLQAPDTRAAQWLLNRGITAEAARMKLLELAFLEDIDFALSREREDYTPLANRCSASFRRACSQAVQEALARQSVQVLPAHLLRGALLGQNDLTDFLNSLDYPVEQLYRLLEPQPVQLFTAPVEDGTPSTLPAAPATITLLRQTEKEALRVQQIGDPVLLLSHLLLAVLADTSSPLHDTVQSLGDVNVLNHRRVLERLMKNWTDGNELL